MTSLHLRRVTSLTAFAMISATATLASAQEPELMEYVVKPGDTCPKILKALYGELDYSKIHKYNALGPTPHRLRPGTVLRVPVVETGPDAHLTGFEGKVNTRPPTRPTWNSGRRGEALYRAWRVNSLDEAFAEITFVDRSTLYMRENTIVVIYGPTFTRTRRRVRRAELTTGALRRFVDDLDGTNTPADDLEVASKAMFVDLGADSAALLSVDDEDTGRVANHGNTPVTVSGRKKGRPTKKVRVGGNMGTRVKRGEAPEPPRPLPPPPAWLPTSTTFLTRLPVGTVRGSWAPSQNATRYRVELSRDRAGRHAVRAVEVPARITSFEVQKLPLGTYFLAVSAIDEVGLEGRPSERRRVTLASMSVTTSAGRALEPDSEVWVGSQVSVPDGVTCKGQNPRAGVLLREEGEVRLDCQSTDGTKVQAPLLHVVRPPIRLIDGDTELAEGTDHVLRFAVPEDVGELDARFEGGGETTGLRRDGAHVEVTTKATAVGPANLLLIKRVGNDEVVLWRQPVAVVASESMPRAERIWRAGGGVGFSLAFDDTLHGEFIESSPRFAARLEVEPLDRLSFGIHGSFQRVPVRDRDKTVAYLTYRGLVGFRVADLGFAPTVVAGAGQEFLLGDDASSSLALYGGLANRLTFGDGAVGLFFDVLATTAADTIGVSALELQTGVIWAF